MWLNALSWEFYLLKYLPKDMFTLEICTAAVNNRACALRYVPAEFQTEELCLLAIRRQTYRDVGIHIKNMTDALYLELEKTKNKMKTHQDD